MSQAVKISDAEMKALREAAAMNSRSISGQAEHWMRIGRAFERSPEFGYSKIERALKGLEPLALDALTETEQEAFFDALGASTDVPTAAENAFWADREQRGLGVGLDENDKLVYASVKKSQ